MPASKHGHAILILLIALSSSVVAGEFPEPYDVEAEGASPPQAKKSLAMMSLPDGFQATLFASEPEVRQPIALAFDERGRLWIVECYTYAEGKRNFDTSLRDRVLILEDTDGDGVHDKRTVFWDEGVKLTSVEIGLGGIWLLAAPQLLFIPDRNGDDLPDGPPEVVLDGWKDLGIRHNIVNGLKWGPDGWLYGRQGILETSLVGSPGATISQRVPINCGIWRYHPVKKKIEAVLRGGTNHWGFDYDAHGEMFAINTVIGHLWHVVPGVYTERMFGSDPNPHLYGLMGQVADHFHWDVGEPWHAIRKGTTDTTRAKGGGHAHSGLMIYQGDNWPAEDIGKVFAINFHGKRLNRDRLEPLAVGFTARHEPDHVAWNDTWFRGIDLASGPDGGVFVIDWCDTGECHEEDGIHRSSGRIYKITYRIPQLIPAFDLRHQPMNSLVEMASRKNKWWSRQARRVLRDRFLAGEDVTAVATSLRDRLHDPASTTARLEALWMLHAIDALPPADLTSLLKDSDPALRVWGVRLFADSLNPDDTNEESARLLGELAQRDPSGQVLLYIASSMQRMSIASRWVIAKAIAEREEFSSDRTLALMTWYGIEPAILAHPEAGRELYQSSRLPLLRRFIARRVAEELEEQPHLIGSLLACDHPADAVLGLTDALEGWATAPEPPGWKSALARLSEPDRAALAESIQKLGVIFGDGRSLEELIALVQSGEIEVRKRALRTLAKARPERWREIYFPLLADRDLRAEAIRALASFDDAEVGQRIIALFPALDEASRSAAVGTLVARVSTARQLLAAIEEGKISAREITAFDARTLRAFGNEDINRKLSALWGEVRESSASKSELVLQFKRELASLQETSPADLKHGRQVFVKQCANCHVLFGQGRTVGPDLTGSQRKNVDYLLENLVDPSAVVAADFRAASVLLDDGRTLQGVISAQNERTITLLLKDETLVLDRKKVDEIQSTQQSLMPEGILNTLSAEERRDLLAYLQADGQIPLAP